MKPAKLRPVKKREHWPKPEFSRGDDGRFDEMVFEKPMFVHFERMSNAHLWCCVTLSDGRDIHMDIRCEENRKRCLDVDVEGR